MLARALLCAVLRLPGRSSHPRPLPTIPPTDSCCRSSRSRTAPATLRDCRSQCSPDTGRPPHLRRSTQSVALASVPRPANRSCVLSQAFASCTYRNPIRPETLDGNGMRRSVFSFGFFEGRLFRNRFGDLASQAFRPVLQQAFHGRGLPVNVQTLNRPQRRSDHHLINARLQLRR